jgi:hypothetical protein
MTATADVFLFSHLAVKTNTSVEDCAFFLIFLTHHVDYLRDETFG